MLLKCSQSLTYQHLQKRQVGISKKNTNLQVHLWLLIQHMNLAPLPCINTFPEHYRCSGDCRDFMEDHIDNIVLILEGVIFLSL